jgi:hypothetical protein
MSSVQMIVPIFLPVQNFWLISWAIVHVFAADSEILPHPAALAQIPGLLLTGHNDL